MKTLFQIVAADSITVYLQIHQLKLKLQNKGLDSAKRKEIEKKIKEKEKQLTEVKAKEKIYKKKERESYKKWTHGNNKDRETFESLPSSVKSEIKQLNRLYQKISKILEKFEDKYSQRGTRKVKDSTVDKAEQAIPKLEDKMVKVRDKLLSLVKKHGIKNIDFLEG